MGKKLKARTDQLLSCCRHDFPGLPCSGLVTYVFVLTPQAPSQESLVNLISEGFCWSSTLRRIAQALIQSIPIFRIPTS